MQIDTEDYETAAKHYRELTAARMKAEADALTEILGPTIEKMLQVQERGRFMASVVSAILTSRPDYNVDKVAKHARYLYSRCMAPPEIEPADFESVLQDPVAE